jgi:hypothetical protein
MAESAAITTGAPDSFHKWPLSQTGNLFHGRAEQPNKEFQIWLFLLFDGGLRFVVRLSKLSKVLVISS